MAVLSSDAGPGCCLEEQPLLLVLHASRGRTASSHEYLMAPGDAWRGAWFYSVALRVLSRQHSPLPGHLRSHSPTRHHWSPAASHAWVPCGRCCLLVRQWERRRPVQTGVCSCGLTCAHLSGPCPQEVLSVCAPVRLCVPVLASQSLVHSSPACSKTSAQLDAEAELALGFPRGCPAQGALWAALPSCAQPLSLPRPGPW